MPAKTFCTFSQFDLSSINEDEFLILSSASVQNCGQGQLTDSYLPVTNSWNFLRLKVFTPGGNIQSITGGVELFMILKRFDFEKT